MSSPVRVIQSSTYGNKGLWGGVSPYTDTDVSIAIQYLKETQGRWDQEVNGRQLAHLLAEFASSANRENTDSLVQRANKAEQELSEALAELKRLADNIVPTEYKRKFKDIE